MIFQGICNTLAFNTWVEKVLLKELTPGQTVIMDNASFHKSKRTQESIEGCKLIFLPSYSPDLNPIEKFWAKLKKWIQKVSFDLMLFHSFLINPFQHNLL
jgi:transposase